MTKEPTDPSCSLKLTNRLFSPLIQHKLFMPSHLDAWREIAFEKAGKECGKQSGRLLILPTLSPCSDRRERRHFPTEEDNQRQMKGDSAERGGEGAIASLLTNVFP